MIKSDVHFTADTDLTDEQISETQTTYNNHAAEYVVHHERKIGALEQAKTRTLDPFLAFYREFGVKGKILFLGCGSGRDLQAAEILGFDVIGLDLSPSMLKIAKDFGVKSQLIVGDILSLNLEPNSLGGVFCESALSHIKKTSIASVLKNIFNALIPGGFALITIREGNGNIYYTLDELREKRFNTTYSLPEARSLIESLGFVILSRQNWPHPVTTRPGFINFIVRKPL